MAKPQNKGGNDKDAFLMQLEDAMRTAFFSQSSSSLGTRTAEQEVVDRLVTKFPNLFGRRTPEEELSLLNDPDHMPNLIQGIKNWNSTIATRYTAQADAFQRLTQQLQQMPLNDKDQESVERLAHSTRDLQVSLSYIQRQMSSLIPMVSSVTKLLWGDEAAAMMDLSIKPSELASRGMSLVGEIRRTPGLDEGISELSQAGVPGMTLLMGQQLDSAMSSMRQLHSAAEHSQLPDLSTFEDFQYQGLATGTSIRILKLVDIPNVNPTPNLIKLRIEEVDLNQNPVFNALSYVWGDHRPPLNQGHSSKRAQRCFHILCNGRNITVTYNLFCFFRRLSTLREGHLQNVRNMPLWIDQLCIHQSNDAEKVAQVAMMDRVYSQARTVVSWLGESDSQTNAAIGLLGRLKAVPRSLIARPDFDVAQFVKDTPSDDWLALSALLSRPYFKRAWIVQEIALANQVLVACGDRTIPWDDLVDCSGILEESKAWTMLSQYVGVFRSAEDQISSSRSRLSLRFGGQLSALLEAQNTIRDVSVSPESLLLLGRQFDATVAVDKFYAMVGLARRRLRSSDLTTLPIIDYSRSLKEVALAFAEYHIQTSGALGLLSLVEDSAHRTQGSHEFPSWLPDPAAPQLPLPLNANGLNGKVPSPWRAGGVVLSKKQAFIDGGSLCVQGHKLDIITQFAASFNSITESGEWFQIFDFLSQSPSLNASGFKLGEALWRTLITSTDPAAGKNPSTVDLDQEFGDWCISLITSVQNPNRKLFDPMTSVAMFQASRLDDTKFDILAFGKDAKDMVQSGNSAAEDVVRSYDLMYNSWDKHEAESQTKSYGKLANQLEDSLGRLWELNRDDILPDPGRIRATVKILNHFRQDGPDRKDIQDRVDRFNAAIGMKLDSRRLFFTKDGRIGMGPQALLEGDEIWALDGAHVPFVIRKGHSRAFRFIGEAFILGVMHGEAAASDHSELVEVLLE